jgi:hypothetical protein
MLKNPETDDWDCPQCSRFLAFFDGDYHQCRCIDGTPGEYSFHHKHLRPWKGFQCKDIPDQPILEFLNRHPGQWHNWYSGNQFNVSQAMPKGIPERLVLGKMRMMIRRGVVNGCDCGCRGDFVITEKGVLEVKTPRAIDWNASPEAMERRIQQVAPLDPRVAAQAVLDALALRQPSAEKFLKEMQGHPTNETDH